MSSSPPDDVPARGLEADQREARRQGTAAYLLFEGGGYVGHMASDFGAQLRAVSLRVTRPRLAVLAALRDHARVDTDTVIALVRAELPRVSHPAVYGVLRALTNAGLVRRMEPAGTTARYESRVGDNHHHVVCLSCGAIADVDRAVGHAPVSPPRMTRLRGRRGGGRLLGHLPDCATRQHCPVIRQFGGSR
ncbi:hypothetical protein GCM10010412_097300 [Nonomuraea recticatena]|uniref:Transcriptional repressor n=1 Tax=Nonomuraea recticatena TaxID=46178 RepID=A0ABP6FVK3_9ACTN